MSGVTEERLIQLEIKQDFLERNLEELDAVVRDLNLELQQLHKELDRLQRQNAEVSSGPLIRPTPLEDEVPPHY